MTGLIRQQAGSYNSGLKAKSVNLFGRYMNGTEEKTMQRHHFYMLALSVSLLAFTVAGLAQPPAKPSDPPKARGAEAAIQRMDINKDGKVSSDEFKTYQMQQIDRRFDYLDGNKDGYITAQELENARDRFREQRRQRRSMQPPQHPPQKPAQ